MINSLRLGSPSFFVRRFDETFDEKVRKFGITETMVAPSMLLRLVERAEGGRDSRFKFHSLRTVLWAGEPLASHVRTRCLQIFDHGFARIAQVCSITEGS